MGFACKLTRTPDLSGALTYNAWTPIKWNGIELTSQYRFNWQPNGVLVGPEPTSPVSSIQAYTMVWPGGNPDGIKFYGTYLLTCHVRLSVNGSGERFMRARRGGNDITGGVEERIGTTVLGSAANWTQLEGTTLHRFVPDNITPVRFEVWQNASTGTAPTILDAHVYMTQIDAEDVTIEL